MGGGAGLGPLRDVHIDLSIGEQLGHIKALLDGIELVGGTEILEKAEAFFSV